MTPAKLWNIKFTAFCMAVNAGAKGFKALRLAKQIEPWLAEGQEDENAGSVVSLAASRPEPPEAA